MSQFVICPHCKAKLSLPADLAGSKVRCAQCNKPIMLAVRSASNLPTVTAESRAAQRSGETRIVSVTSEDMESLQMDDLPQPTAAPAAPVRLDGDGGPLFGKKCPDCGTLIQFSSQDAASTIICEECFSPFDLPDLATAKSRYRLDSTAVRRAAERPIAIPMSPTRVACPHCMAQDHWKPELAGQPSQCKQCEKSYVLPSEQRVAALTEDHPTPDDPIPAATDEAEPVPQSTNCPHCDAELNYMPQHAGKRVQCAGCRQAFVLPEYDPSTGKTERRPASERLAQTREENNERLRERIAKIKKEPGDTKSRAAAGRSTNIRKRKSASEDDGAPEASAKKRPSKPVLIGGGVGLLVLIVVGVLLVGGKPADEAAWLEFKANPSFSAAEIFRTKFPKSKFNAKVESALWKDVDQDGKGKQKDYLDYVAMYPDSSNAGVAEVRLEALFWRQVETENSVESYRNYLSRFTDTLHAEISREKLEAILWKRAEGGNTIASYNAYLSELPEGVHAKDAKRLISEIEWEAAEEAHTAESYQAFLDKYPESHRAWEAKQNIDLIKAAQSSMAWGDLESKIKEAVESRNAKALGPLLEKAETMADGDQKLVVTEWKDQLRIFEEITTLEEEFKERRPMLEEAIPEAQERYEKIRKIVLEEEKEARERAGRMEKALVEYTEKFPFTLDINDDFQLKNVKVGGFDGDRITLFLEGGGEVEFSVHTLPRQTKLKLFKAALKRGTAYDYYHVGVVYLRSGLYDDAAEAFTEAGDRDESLKGILPDMERIRLASRVFQGEFEMNGNLLSITWPFKTEDEIHDFQAGQGTVKVVPGSGLSFGGERVAFATVKSIPFVEKVRATVTAGPSTTSAPILGIQYARPDGDVVIFYIAAYTPTKEAGIQRITNGVPEVIRQGIKYTGDDTLGISFDSGQLTFTLGGQNVWSGAEGGFAHCSVLTGGLNPTGGPVQVTMTKMKVDGFVSPQWVQKELATFNTVIEAELAKGSHITDDESGERDLSFTYTVDVLLASSYSELARKYNEAISNLKRAYTEPDWQPLWAEAARLLEECHEEYPFFSAAGFVRSRMLEDLGRFRPVVNLLDDAIEREPDFAEALARRAGFHLRILEWEEARPLVKRALEMKPDLAFAHLVQAKIYKHDGDIEEAIRSSHIAEKLAPSDAKVRTSSRALRNVIKGPPWTKANEVKTRHYIIRGDLPKQKLEEYAAKMEAIRPDYETVTGLRPPMTEPSVILVFNTSEGYYGYLEFTAGQRLEQTNGLYNPNYGQMMVIDDPNPEKTLHVMFHEGFHQHLNGVLTDAPIWLNEGMAEYVAGVVIKNGKVVKRGTVLSDRLLNLQQSFNMGWNGEPFDELMLQPQSVFYGENGALKYAQAWSMIHYFMLGDGGKYKKVLQKYIELLTNGVEFLDAYAQTFGAEDLDAMEKGWRKHVDKLKS